MSHVILKINYYRCLLVNITWCQKCSGKMASLCKPPDPLSLTGNVAQNCRDFEEQLKWYLTGTEVNDKADLGKIGIMVSLANKEARDIYRMFNWRANGDQNKLDKVLEAFQRYCSPRKNIIYECYRFWTI